MSDALEHKGLVVLVGAGPGDQGLITVAAAGWLARADVIVYDRLASPALLSRGRREAELIYVGKGRQGNAMSQPQINELLVEKCREGKLVVRLKGGDPLMFGRGGEELAALAAAGLPFRVVPGVTAATAAGACAGIPLTDRRVASSVAFVTGQEDPAKAESRIDWTALARIDTLVFYMGVTNLPEIAERLRAAGRAGDTPAAIVERAASPSQRVTVATLATLADVARDAAVQAPAITIVGEVVRLREAMAWFEHLPMAGKRVLVTRAPLQAAELSASLAELGAEVIEAPTIEIRPADDVAAIDAAAKRLGEYDWVVLTSPNGVAVLFERLASLRLDARALAGAKVAAVGQATAAALAAHGIRADLVPETFTTSDLGGALLAREGLYNKRVLLARADIAGLELTRMLEGNGAKVDSVTLYRTACPAELPPAAVEALAAGRVDWITFTSASTVDNFMTLLAKHGVTSGSVKLAAIGPVTARAMKAHGLVATVVAASHTAAGVANAIAQAR